MGTETVMNDISLQKRLDTTDSVFLVIFTVEICLQLFANGIEFFDDSFYIFDLCVITMSWLPYIPGLKGLPNFQIFRTCRTIRLFRVIRYLSYFRALNDIVLFISEVLPVLGHLFYFLIFLWCIFSVLFTELYEGMCFEE